VNSHKPEGKMPTQAASLRDLLGPQLPYIRRYARALAGSQSSGDAFVRAALEAMLENAAAIDVNASPKLALFQLFHSFWNPHRTTMQDNEQIAGLHATGREALLLTAVEGFSLEEAALILGIGADEVDRSVSDAERAIALAMRSRVLIIEDEPVIAMHLAQILTDMGHQVVDTAISRAEAVESARRLRPDIVLADIQLADGSSGIDAVQQILAMFDVPVVFVTAYPERLLTGLRPEPTFLVTKPFDPEAIVAIVGQALLQRQPGVAPQGLQVGASL
jgi:CheY-like chemotaxis protein